MSNDRTNIDGIAAAWVAREDRGPLSVQEREQLGVWLESDRRHLGAYARARAVFQAWLDATPDDPKAEERARSVLAR